MRTKDDETIQKDSASRFRENSGEWRRLFAELWGTFLLVLVGAGGKVVAAQFGDISKAMETAAPGMMVMVIIYAMGSVSGAHINPAVTIAFALRNHFPWRRVPMYIFVQLIGGILACLFIRALLGTTGDLGATHPAIGLPGWKAVIIELLLTVGLINTILGTASGPRNIGHNAALAIGAYIIIAGFWAGPLTGASMNIVRSVAPDIVRGDFHNTWIYLLGPLTAIPIAVAFEWILKGKPSSHATKEAQGGE